MPRYLIDSLAEVLSYLAQGVNLALPWVLGVALWVGAGPTHLTATL
jgi:hypothetical protein